MIQKGIDLSPYADAEFLIEYSSLGHIEVDCKLLWKEDRKKTFPFSFYEEFYVCPDKKTTEVFEVLFGKGTPRMIFLDDEFNELIMVGYD